MKRLEAALWMPARYARILCELLRAAGVSFNVQPPFRLLLSALLCLTAALEAADAISPAAKAYLDTAMQVMQEHFLHRDKIDWEQLKRETLAQAAGAQTAVETYPAIRFALGKLGDHHSFLELTPALMSEASKHGIATWAPPAAPPRDPTKPAMPSPFRSRRAAEGAMVVGAAKPIAQVVIPLFSGPDLDGFATKIQGVIADLAAKKPCGWIVDLRGNGGGNIWPMMAGVGPILGEGPLGGHWYYENGRSGDRADKDDPYYAKSNGPPVKLSGTPPVAVLIDRDTASSGEGIAIAFRGRPGTRFFGESTAGLATSTFPYELSDGAKMYLVIGAMVDRSGSEYPLGVAPDDEILSETSITTTDPVIRGAAEWLSAQRGCRAR